MHSVHHPTINSSEIDFWIELTLLNASKYKKSDILEIYGESQLPTINKLVDEGFLLDINEFLILPNRSDLVKILIDVIPFSHKFGKADKNLNFDKVKTYLASVQKQLSYFETEGKKAFLTLRTMVEKIVIQAKNYIKEVFERSLSDFKDSTAWINIPHVSPIGIYEPIEEIRNKFNIVMEELDLSISNLVDEHLTNLSISIDPLHKKLGNIEFTPSNSNTNDFDRSKTFINTIKTNIDQSREKISQDIGKFSEEVNIAVKLQFDQLEANLGKDLIEQFDAIERLNELDPKRIVIKLEQTKNEMNVHLNSIYSRLLREINTLQMILDVSKVSIILTNEAGKLMKEMNLDDL